MSGVINNLRDRARFLRSARVEREKTRQADVDLALICAIAAEPFARAKGKSLAVAAGKGSFSLEAAARILRTTPERLRDYTQNRAASDHGEFFSEEELHALWPVFRE